MAEEPYEYFERIRARRFELVDDDMNVRAALSVEHESDLIGLHAGDREAHPVISIGVDEETNVPYVIMREPLRANRVTMPVTLSGAVRRGRIRTRSPEVEE